MPTSLDAHPWTPPHLVRKPKQTLRPKWRERIRLGSLTMTIVWKPPGCCPHGASDRPLPRPPMPPTTCRFLKEIEHCIRKIWPEQGAKTKIPDTVACDNNYEGEIGSATLHPVRKCCTLQGPIRLSVEHSFSSCAVIIIIHKIANGFYW